MRGIEGEGNLFERYGKVIPRGTVLFYEGDPGREMYIILSGKVRISKRVRNVEKTLVLLGKGEFFGEMAILNDKPRSATATVMEDCEILIIDRETFETMIRNNGEIAVRVIKKLAARLQEADHQMENLLLKDNLSRLVNQVKRAASEQGAPDYGEFSLNYSRSDLASDAGVSERHIDELLKKLSSANLIRVSGDRMTISKMETLERFLHYLEMKDQFSHLS